MPVDAESLKTELRAFMASNFMLSDQMLHFADGDSFLKKGIIDSMGVIELLAFVQKKYGIQVRPEEVVPANFDSLDALSSFVILKNGKPAS